MSRGKSRGKQPAPDEQAGLEDEPVRGSDPEPEPATIVEGDAVELPSGPAAGSDAPPAYEPEIHATPAAPPPRYPPEATPAGHVAGSAPAHAAAAASAPGWPDPGIDLTERPEIVVGAAFGGGLLLALILRKLGH